MSTYDFGTGGYDIEFRRDTLSNGQELIVCAKIGITEDDVADPDTAKCFIVIGKDSNSYYFVARDKNGDDVDEFESQLSALGLIRVVFHNEFCTIYVDHYWIYTFGFDDIYHNVDPEVGLKTTGGGITVYDLRKKELSDWREAVYVELEISSQNAIRTAILQRPVDIYPNWEGRLVCEYNPNRNSDSVYFVKKHSEKRGDNSQACSDAVIQSTYAAVVTDVQYAMTDGFVTRMYRLPDLDSGYVQAAQIMQDRARRSNKEHSVQCRINIHFEIGDIANVSATVSGTGRSLSESFVIENMSLSISEAKQQMSLSGRDANA